MGEAFSGVVLAGGASRRMGRDKAFVEVDGRPMALLAAEALASAGAAEVFVVGGDRVGFEALGLAWVADRHPGQGPLGGIITALSAAAQPVAAVLACDHLSPAVPAIGSIVGALGEADAAVPVVEGRRQTLHAAWRRSALARLESVFAAGGRSVRDGLAELAVVELLDGDPCWYRDADTPDDLP